MPKDAASLEMACTAMALRIYNLVSTAGESLNIPLAKSEIDRNVVFEVAAHYLKDVSRIREHQSDAIAPQQRIGFLVFWIVKLKPIRIAQGRFPDINERLALTSGLLMVGSLPYGTDPGWDVQSIPGSPAEKSARLFRTVEFYYSAGFDTLVYSLRHRNLTGDAMALLFGALLRMANFWSDSRDKKG
ncbi:MAG: hypothetical protein ACKO1J_02095 [Tagaea sp.]